MSIQWLHPDDPAPRSSVRLVKPGETLHAILLDRPVGLITHYIPEFRRSYPCRGERNCPHCRAGISQQRDWYVSVMLLDPGPYQGEWRQCVVSVSAGAKTLLGENARRGTRALFIRERREDGRRNGRVSVVIRETDLYRLRMQDKSLGDALPDPGDLQDAIRRLHIATPDDGPTIRRLKNG